MKVVQVNYTVFWVVSQFEIYSSQGGQLWIDQQEYSVTNEANP